MILSSNVDSVDVVTDNKIVQTVDIANELQFRLILI